MQFGKALSFVFNDPDWIKKVGIAALVFFVPAVGGILVLGWALEIASRVISGSNDPLPDWSNIGEHLKRGFFATVVSVAYSLPLIILMSCFYGITIAATIAASEGNNSNADSIMTMMGLCMSCAYVIIGIPTGFFSLAALGNLAAANGELGAGFRFNEIMGLLRAAPGAYAIAVFGGAIIASVLVPLGMLVCFVGMFFTAAYAAAVTYHLVGQAYLEAKSKGAA